MDHNPSHRKIGFIELPDAALDIITRYSQNRDWTVVLVVSLNPQSYSARMAEILHIPVIDTPNRPALLLCDRIVVGTNPSNLAEVMREMIGDAVELWTLAEAMRDLGLSLEGLEVDVPSADRAQAARPGRIFRPRLVETPEGPPAVSPVGPATAPGASGPASRVDETGLRSLLASLPPDAGGTEILDHVLRAALQTVEATRGTFLIPDDDGRHLRTVVQHGISDRDATGWRERIGVGPAGEAFASGIARVVHESIGRHPSGEPIWSDRIFVPVPGPGRPAAILTAMVPPTGNAGDHLAALGRVALVIAGAVAKAIDLLRLGGTLAQNDLFGEIEHVMKAHRSLPDRLAAACDLLGRVFHADYAHVFLVDQLGRRLSLLGPGRGMVAENAQHQTLDRGFFGWVVRRGTAQVLEASDPRTSERQGILCFPIESSHPHGLLVLENVPLGTRSTEEILRQIAPIVEHVSALVAEEEGEDVRVLQSQLALRVRDRLEDMAAAASPQAEALLALATEALAAEAAVWLSEGPGAEPEIYAGQASGAELLEQARPGFEAIAAWVRERGAVAGGAFAPGWDVRAPRGPSPYVGVTAPEAGGVLVVFFSPDEEAGAAAQLPPQVHFETLLQIASAFPPSARRAA